MKVDDLSVWEAFYWTAKEGNFTRAAGRMNLGLPALSKKIARLEEALGLRLFQRSTRKVSLTHEGETLLPQVTALLEDMKGIEAAADRRGEPVGTIRLTCLTGVAHRLLAPVLVEFRKLHPRIEFDLDVSDGVVDLIEGQFDLAIRIQAPTGADFVFKKLVANDLVLCASPEYLKRAKSIPAKPSQLSEHPLYFLQAHENCRFAGSDFTLAKAAKTRPIRCESGLYLTELALNGAGIVARSLWDVGEFIEKGRLRQLCPKHPLESYGHLYAVVPNRRFLAPRVRVFVDFLERRAKNW